MWPSSVSSRSVTLASIPVGILLALVGIALLRPFGLRADGYGSALGLAAVLYARASLVPGVLAALGIRVRDRSVERLMASGRDPEEESADGRPVRIDGGRGLRGVLIFVPLVGGLACLVLAGCLVFVEFPSGVRDGEAVFLLGLLEGSVVLLGAAFLARRWCKLKPLCEISEEGILAPDGLLARPTFMAWSDLAGCEIVHDDERAWCDYFILWDRSGRRRFRSSETWMGRVRRADRDRILRALRARFPRKDISDPVAALAPLDRPSAAIWDRELDG